MSQKSIRARSRLPLVATASFALLASLIAVPAAAQVPLFADGFESGNAFAWSERVPPPPVADAFRLADLDLRDPHVFIDLPLVGCFDFTDNDLPAGLGPSFNSQIETQITTDGDGDGFLDLSSLLAFRPFDDLAVDGRLDFTAGLCTAPLAGTTCTRDLAAVPRTVVYDGLTAGTCLEPLPATTSGYLPAVPVPTPPCVVSKAADTGLSLNGLTVPLQDVQVAGDHAGAPVMALGSGLMMGFLTETAAGQILLPPDVPLVGGQPLTVLLPGGAGSCAAGDDRDIHDGETGWWFYLEFSADLTPYAD